MHLASVVLPEPLRPTIATRLARRDVERDVLEDGRRLRPAVAEAQVAEARRAPRAIAPAAARERSRALLRLVLEDVVQAVEQHRRALEVVPQREQRRGSAPLASATSELNATSPPIVSWPSITSWAPTHRKSAERQERDRVDRRPRSDITVKSARNSRRATPWNCSSISVAERRLAAERLHGLDALDRVDLVRVVPAERLLERCEIGRSHFTRRQHQQRVERRRRQEHEREPRAVDEHQHDVAASCTTAVSPAMPCCTRNSRTCRMPSSRRWMSPVRRVAK